MKNLFLAAAMLLSVTIASAQQTPTKTKQSKTTVDSTTTHKSKTMKQSHKTDTVSKQHKNKAAKKSTTTSPATRRDSIGGTTTP
jgi:hypothetical protein